MYLVMLYSSSEDDNNTQGDKGQSYKHLPDNDEGNNTLTYTSTISGLGST